MELKKQVDVCVVGAGHAGCEAALACARLGLKTVIFTVSVDSIALMPCNPNVGGSSKGHLVRELDALGGEMGKNIDKTFIQSKMLNVSKGPAVHSLRAQADKAEYSRAMRKVLENQDNLLIKQAEVCELLWEETEDHKKMIEMCPTEKQKRLIKKRIQYFGEEKVLFYEKHFFPELQNLENISREQAQKIITGLRIPRVIRGVCGRDK